MAQQPFTFDKNEFLKEVLRNTMLSSWINRNIEALNYPGNRDRNGNVANYNGPTSEDYFDKLRESDRNHIHIARALYEMYKNPNGQEALELNALWKLVSPVFVQESSPYEQDYLMILKKMDSFNEEVQQKLLHHMFYVLSDNPNVRRNIPKEKIHELRKNIAIRMAMNPNATLRDMYDATETTHNMDIARDTVEMAKREIDKEMKKDFPDTETISRICQYARGAAYQVSYINKEYADAVNDEFNMEKILRADATYIPQLRESLEEEILKLRKENDQQKANYVHDANTKNVQISALERDVKFAQENLENEQQKNEKLVRQLNEMQSALLEMQTAMKTIQMKAAAINVKGMFGMNKKAEAVAELNDYIKEAMSKNMVMIKD